jgi:hypothetical protein
MNGVKGKEAWTDVWCASETNERTDERTGGERRARANPLATSTTVSPSLRADHAF